MTTHTTHSRISSPRLPILTCLLSSICLLLLTILPLTQSQSTITSYDCVDPNDRERTHQVRRGDPTTICLYVGPDGDWNSNIDYKRFSVNLIADEFSSYDVPGSFEAIVKTDATHIFAASQSSLSFLRRYYDKTTQRIYPFLTAVIDVQDGIVMGIAWDDACVFCEKNMCLANTYNFDGSVATTEQINQPTDGCYLTVEECNGFMRTGSNQCDLKLYVVWTGTDVNGNVLLSSNSRFSMFPPNRLQENVMGQYNKMIDTLKNIKGTLTFNKN